MITGSWKIPRSNRGEIDVQPGGNPIITIRHELLQAPLSLSQDKIDFVSVLDRKPPRLLAEYKAFPTDHGPLFWYSGGRARALLPILSRPSQVPTVAIGFTVPLQLGITKTLMCGSHQTQVNGFAIGLLIPVKNFASLDTLLGASVKRQGDKIAFGLLER